MKRIAVIIGAVSMACLIGVLLLPLTSPSDEVTSHYATLSEAKNDNAFARGWLPPILPESARAIVERNDLDVNVGVGDFEYDPAERAAYIARLQALGGTLSGERKMEVVTLRQGRTAWTIELPQSAGSGSYTVRNVE